MTDQTSPQSIDYAHVVAQLGQAGAIITELRRHVGDNTTLIEKTHETTPGGRIWQQLLTIETTIGHARERARAKHRRDEIHR